jgi:hypothetical protein
MQDVISSLLHACRQRPTSRDTSSLSPSSAFHQLRNALRRSDSAVSAFAAVDGFSTCLAIAHGESSPSRHSRQRDDVDAGSSHSDGFNVGGNNCADVNAPECSAAVMQCRGVDALFTAFLFLELASADATCQTPLTAVTMTTLLADTATWAVGKCFSAGTSLDWDDGAAGDQCNAARTDRRAHTAAFTLVVQCILAAVGGRAFHTPVTHRVALTSVVERDVTGLFAGALTVIVGRGDAANASLVLRVLRSIADAVGGSSIAPDVPMLQLVARTIASPAATSALAGSMQLAVESAGAVNPHLAADVCDVCCAVAAAHLAHRDDAKLSVAVSGWAASLCRHRLVEVAARTLLNGGVAVAAIDVSIARRAAAACVAVITAAGPEHAAEATVAFGRVANASAIGVAVGQLHAMARSYSPGGALLQPVELSIGKVVVTTREIATGGDTAAFSIGLAYGAGCDVALSLHSPLPSDGGRIPPKTSMPVPTAGRDCLVTVSGDSDRSVGRVDYRRPLRQLSMAPCPLGSLPPRSGRGAAAPVLSRAEPVALFGATGHTRLHIGMLTPPETPMCPIIVSAAVVGASAPMRWTLADRTAHAATERSGTTVGSRDGEEPTSPRFHISAGDGTPTTPVRGGGIAHSPRRSPSGGGGMLSALERMAVEGDGDVSTAAENSFMRSPSPRRHDSAAESAQRHHQETHATPPPAPPPTRSKLDSALATVARQSAQVAALTEQRDELVRACTALRHDQTLTHDDVVAPLQAEVAMLRQLLGRYEASLRGAEGVITGLRRDNKAGEEALRTHIVDLERARISADLGDL